MEMCAQTSTYDDDRVKEFYKQLESTIKEITREISLLYKVTGMLRLDVMVMPLNNGRKQRDALERAKPIKHEKDM